MKNLFTMIVEEMKEPEIERKIYFTSDTHFGSERALELSFRPFKTVNEMDSALISNWNKTVSENDIVYHLGDFGNLEVLRKLNFRALNLLLGNYERKDYENTIKTVNKIKEETRKEINVLEKPIFLHGILDHVCIQHEPLNSELIGDENIKHLFGHIHGRQAVKKNGIDVGVDSNNYFPLSKELVLKKLEAIKFYDENVFCELCN